MPRRVNPDSARRMLNAADEVAAEPRATDPADSTGRVRHSEKITVYISSEELLRLEKARLDLRGDYQISVDRGRLVREAIAAALNELDQDGADSTLIRRLLQ